jgi:DNA-binding response OmpR family regulator
MPSEPENRVPSLHLLLVEDHDSLREVMAEVLAAAGHHVLGVGSAEAIDELPAGFNFDIALLDLNLPGEDGLALAARLRRIHPGVGIIMVTARYTLDAKLAGYAHGADLYLTKPTEPQELCAAVLSLARRLSSCTPDSSVSGFRLVLTTRVLLTPQGPLPLRGAEAALLQALALAPGHSLEYWQLLAVLDKAMDAQGKTQLEVLVSRLRTKLLAHDSPANPLQAVRGRGYRLTMAMQLE